MKTKIDLHIITSGIVCYQTTAASGCKTDTSINKQTDEAFTLKLTPSAPAGPNCCCSKRSAPYWSNPVLGRSGALALTPERQSARVSKIKNTGLDQYGNVQSLNGIGDERVKQLQMATCGVMPT